MKTNRKVLYILPWILLWAHISVCEEEEKAAESPPKHENFPRFFSIFSRPGEKSAEKQESRSFGDHLGNVFKGGSIGFQVEARPLAPFRGMMDKAKDVNPFASFQGFIDKAKEVNPLHGFIDKAKDFIPIPFGPGITSNKKDTDRKDVEEVEEKKVDELESEEPWEPQNPDNPNPEGPEYESIGEKADEDLDHDQDYTTEAIENIINPRSRVRSRMRQKRSPESRVFHVPLQFLSNAKPFEVHIK